MSICGGIAGSRWHNPKGIFIHNDAGTKNANASFYKNWLKSHDLSAGFAHYYVASDGMLQAERADSNVPVSDEIMEEVAAYSQRVADGSLKLPTTLEEVDSFLAEYAE